MSLCFKDIKGKFHKDMMVEFDICPVGRHNFNEKVERKICQIKESLEKSVSNQRLSVLQWETVAGEISNTINDLPLALGNLVSDFENIDLITPNRVRLGKNNDQSPVSPMKVTGNYQKMLEENKKIYNTWFEVWLIFICRNWMDQPKWFQSSRDVKICDVVPFNKKDGSLVITYQYGMIHQLERSKDDLIQKAIVKYCNHNESVDIFTTRAMHELVLIHPIDELHLIEELGNIASTNGVAINLNKRK